MSVLYLTVSLSDAAKRLSLFQKRLNDIEKLWYLDPDKSSVEHRLAQYVESHNEQETPAHSLILDTDDEDIRILFEDDEWGQIMELVPQLPDTDAVLKNYLDLFRSVSFFYSTFILASPCLFFQICIFRKKPWMRSKISWSVGPFLRSPTKLLMAPKDALRFAT